MSASDTLFASRWGVSERAAAVHDSATVWDNTLPWRDYGDPDRRARCLPRMHESGHNVVSLTLSGDRNGLSDTIHKIAKERRYFRSRPNEFVLVEGTHDIERAKRENKLAVVFHFQGSNPVDNDPDMVEVYYRLGIRHILLVYNLKNPVGDGCKERTDAGLSRFGEMLVREMRAHDPSHTLEDIFLRLTRPDPVRGAPTDVVEI